MTKLPGCCNRIWTWKPRALSPGCASSSLRSKLPTERSSLPLLLPLYFCREKHPRPEGQTCEVQRMGQCPSNPSPARLRFLGSDHKPEHKAPSRSGTWQVPRDEGREVRIAWLSSLHTKSFPFSKLLTPLLHVLKFSMYIVPDTFMYTWFIPLIPFHLN